MCLPQRQENKRQYRYVSRIFHWLQEIVALHTEPSSPLIFIRHLIFSNRTQSTWSWSSWDSTHTPLSLILFIVIFEYLNMSTYKVVKWKELELYVYWEGVNVESYEIFVDDVVFFFHDSSNRWQWSRIYYKVHVFLWTRRKLKQKLCHFLIVGEWLSDKEDMSSLLIKFSMQILNYRSTTLEFHSLANQLYMETIYIHIISGL